MSYKKRTIAEIEDFLKPKIELYDQAILLDESATLEKGEELRRKHGLTGGKDARLKKPLIVRMENVSASFLWSNQKMTGGQSSREISEPSDAMSQNKMRIMIKEELVAFFQGLFDIPDQSMIDAIKIYFDMGRTCNDKLCPRIKPHFMKYNASIANHVMMKRCFLEPLNKVYALSFEARLRQLADAASMTPEEYKEQTSPSFLEGLRKYNSMIPLGDYKKIQTDVRSGVATLWQGAMKEPVRIDQICFSFDRMTNFKGGVHWGIFAKPLQVTTVFDLEKASFYENPDLEDVEPILESPKERKVEEEKVFIRSKKATGNRKRTRMEDDIEEGEEESKPKNKNERKRSHFEDEDVKIKKRNRYEELSNSEGEIDE